MGRFPDQATAALREAAAVKGVKGMTAREKIEEGLSAIRPALHVDGGDVELVAYDEADGVVQLRLMGACESCPISMMTLKGGMERGIGGGVPAVTQVLAL